MLYFLFLFLFTWNICFAQEKSLLESKDLFRSYQFDKSKKKNMGDELFSFSLSAECEPLTTVADCVNVISGNFFQVDRDILTNTIDPLSLTRFYDSGSHIESTLGFGFGSQFPLWASDIEKHTRHHYGLISEREGFLLLYRDKEAGPSKYCTIDPRVLENGYTNQSRATVSGHANFVNWRAIFKDEKWQIKLGDGTKRIYGKRVYIGPVQLERMQFPSNYGYLLIEEIKPNRNRLLFSYDYILGRQCLKQIESVNSKGKSLNKLSFQYEKEKCSVSDEYGNSATYTFDDRMRLYLDSDYISGRAFLAYVDTRSKGLVSYKTNPITWKVDQILKPESRTQSIEYYPSGRVRAIFEPLETFDPVRRFSFLYFQEHTEVRDSLNQSTAYFFDSRKRLSKIDYLCDSKSIREDRFEWSKNKGEEGWLKSKSIQKGNDIFCLKTFDYDARGNIINETVIGQLTGEKKCPFRFSEIEKMDSATTRYEYRQDSRNLVKKMITASGLTTYYDYLPKTNLRTKTLIEYSGKIQERIFCAYDENGQLQSLIEDDGSGENLEQMDDITYRKVKRFVPVTETSAAFGKPKKISDYYIDISGNEILLKETHLAYDANGLESERKITDSKGKRFISTKKYDGRYRLKEETNPLGHTLKYEYDERNNKIQEILLDANNHIYKTIQYDYDFGNRLTKKTEIFDNLDQHITSYKYNALDQLISKTDSYGHETTYEYDRLGNQTICSQPPYQDPQGNSIARDIKRKYNPLNQLISETNENGHTTQYAYNVYGSPISIEYPDQSKEMFTYYPIGWMKCKTLSNDSSISYSYDEKGHLIKQTFFDEKENQLKSEEFIYKGSLLKSKIDSMGLVTTFEYDRAARKIKEQIGDLKTVIYSYDDFDRLISKKIEGYEESFDYDPLDRIVAKTIKTNDLLISRQVFEYDIHGHQVKKTIWISEDQYANYQAHYNSDGAIAWKENPLGHRTSWEHLRQSLDNGKEIRTRSIADPLQRVTKETDNIQHLLSKQELVHNQKPYSTLFFEYDPMGNITKRQVDVMSEGIKQREYTIHDTYNSRGLLESEIERPSGKKTSYTYNPMGNLDIKIKPDGILLYHTYDALGRLKSLSSSDKTIHYAYSYDLHDNIIQVEDLIHKFTQTREFDLLDRLIKEEIYPGIILNYHYDKLDRLTRLILPDQSSVSYSYQPHHLSKIERYSKSKQLLYTIECPEYDLRGNLLKSVSPAGMINYAYDLLGRTVSINSPVWSSFDHAFDAAGNLLSMTRNNPQGICHENFSYDRFNHLSKEAFLNHQYTYDSLGNCLAKDNRSQTLNSLNQITHHNGSSLTYDKNGNLSKQDTTIYTYDALNRLIRINDKTELLYDAFGRCLHIKEPNKTRHLLYQGNQEIGSLVDQNLDEFRLIHPKAQEMILAIELQEKSYFPIQDSFHNLCALQNSNGSIAQLTKYSAFGEKQTEGEISVPWSYANRREIENLILFTHRFYNPALMRWQTPDPIGFADHLNLYTYVRNNPFAYHDPDGQFAFVIPIVIGAFGAGGITISATTAGTIVGAAIGTAVGWCSYKVVRWIDHSINQEGIEDTGTPVINSETKGRKRGNDNEIKGGPPRAKGSANYIPDPAAEGTPHTTLGKKKGSSGTYTQGATFDKDGEFKGRTDVTDHGRHDHHNPHFHPASGPNSANNKGEPITDFFWKGI